MRWMVIGLGALALAGCSSQENGSNSSDKNGAPVTGGGQDQPTPSNLTDDPQNGVEPVTLPSPAAVSSIPAAFQGRWGMVVNDCAPEQGGSKGLMVVTGSGLSLGGSRVPVSSLAMIGSSALTVELADAGGVRSATRAARLTLLDDGNTLVRQEQNSPALRYSRCPA